MALSYESSGVRYDQLDAFKRACQQAARTTAGVLAGHGYSEPATTRGESAYLIEAADHFLAHVEEGLGTKNLVADAVYAATGKCFYREISIDTVATMVNDLVTCGALPISVAMHAAVGDSSWFADETRTNALVAGFAEGCREAGAVWGGGETPTLGGIVEPEAIVLAGSAIGKISLCRKVAAQLPQGYQTPIGHGDLRTFGEALLAPSVIYVAFVRECQRRGLKLNYVAHVTGHGWRKLMRLDEPFVYEITDPRPAPALFQFLQEAGPIEQREMYATFNQGVGFAAYVAPENVVAVLAAAKDTGYDAWLAGNVQKDGTRKAVTVPSLGLTFGGETLQVR